LNSAEPETQIGTNSLPHGKTERKIVRGSGKIGGPSGKARGKKGKKPTKNIEKKEKVKERPGVTRGDRRKRTV